MSTLDSPKCHNTVSGTRWRYLLYRAKCHLHQGLRLALPLSLLRTRRVLAVAKVVEVAVVAVVVVVEAEEYNAVSTAAALPSPQLLLGPESLLLLLLLLLLPPQVYRLQEYAILLGLKRYTAAPSPLYVLLLCKLPWLSLVAHSTTT